MAETPKIFISYCWSNPDHEDWVISLAEKLVSDGVNVIIDKWDLKEGQDKINFMETMVKADEIQKVLIILDKKYSEKAEQRTGGVGTETQIISPEIYGNVSQEKFVPIVKEKDENGNAYVPTYLKSRIYIDLSEQNDFEENYEKLLRNIYQRPAFRKPILGKAPSYLFEDSPMSHKTSSIIRSFDNQIKNYQKPINSIVRDFLDGFFEDLKGYSVNIDSKKDLYTFGKIIHDNIISYTPLRNDYILFLDKLLKSELEFDIDLFIKFFEKLPILKSALDNRSSLYTNEFENFRFIIHEIFLYTIATGLKNESYNFLEEILYSEYFFQRQYNNINEPCRFNKLYNYVEIFDQYYRQTFSCNFISPMADLLIKRLPDNINTDELVNADLLCHYITVLDGLFNWFPITYIYKSDRINIDLFSRLISFRHFEKVKTLFNVKTVKELQEKLMSVKTLNKESKRIRHSGSFESVASIYELIEIEKIGTIR